jgi:hypothetical protein
MAVKKDKKDKEDTQLTEEVVKVGSEIVSLKNVTNKLVAFGQKDSDRQTAADEKLQQERLDVLNQEILAGDGRTREIKALKIEAIAIQDSFKVTEDANAKLAADSAAALGMDKERYESHLELKADAEKSNAYLESLGQSLLDGGLKPEDLADVAEYSQASAEAAELNQKIAADALENAPSKAKLGEESDDTKADSDKQSSFLKKIAGGIGGLFKMGKSAAKDKLKSAKKGIMGILQTTLVAGFAIAAVAFLNSKYWEQTKEMLVEKLLPALKDLFTFVKDVIIPPMIKLFHFIKDEIWPIIKDGFIAGWNRVKKVFADIGEAMDLFSEGDTKGGIKKLFGSLGTFFKDTLDGLVTFVFNLLGKVLGFEGTDSVGAKISKYLTDIKNDIVKTFDDTVKKIKEFDPIKDVMDAIEKLFDFVADLIPSFDDVKKLAKNIVPESAMDFVDNLLGDADPKNPFSKKTSEVYGEAGFGRGTMAERGFLGGLFSTNKGETPANLVPSKSLTSMGLPTEKTSDIRAREMTEAKLSKATGQGAPIIISSPTTSVIDNSSSSATHMSTPLTNNNQTVNAVNYAR